jgi:hypothetical protein
MPTLTLRAIEDAFRASWSDETCDVADLPDWTPENPSRGQCGVTSLLLQDLLGGELLEAHVLHANGSHQGWHYWNRLEGGVDVDLTLEQFRPDEVVQPPKVVARAVPGPPLRSPERYVLLRERVLAQLGLDEA